jgi:hypothetical protein
MNLLTKSRNGSLSLFLELYKSDVVLLLNGIFGMLE